MSNALAPLRYAGFRRVVLSRLVTNVGNGMAPIALAFAVLDLTGSAADLGLVLAARTLPMVGFLLFGGVFADRLPRHLVIAGGSAASLLSQAVAATLLLTGHAEMWQLVVVEAVNGAAVAFIMPAMTGLTPQLVPSAELQHASAMGGFARNGGRIVGAALGGVLVAAAGPGWGLAVDAATFAVAGLLLLGVTLPPVVRDAGTSVLRELRDGWAEFASRTWLWVVVAAFGGLMAIEGGAWETLGPVIANGTIGRAAWGLVEAGQSIGTIASALLMLRLRFTRPLVAGMVGMAGPALFLLMLAFWPSTVPLVALATLAGLGIGVFAVTWDTAMARHIPTTVLSRVSAYDALGSLVAMPVGQIVAGRLAGWFGATPVVAVGAVAYLMIAAATLLCRDVRRLGEHPEPARVAEPVAP